MSVNVNMPMQSLSAAESDCWYVDRKTVRRDVILPRMVLSSRCNGVIQLCNATPASIVLSQRMHVANAMKLCNDDVCLLAEDKLHNDVFAPLETHDKRRNKLMTVRSASTERDRVKM